MNKQFNIHSKFFKKYDEHRNNTYINSTVNRNQILQDSLCKLFIFLKFMKLLTLI